MGAHALCPAARLFRRRPQAAIPRPGDPPNSAYEESRPTVITRAANLRLRRWPRALRSAPDRPKTARRLQTTTNQSWRPRPAGQTAVRTYILPGRPPEIPDKP